MKRSISAAGFEDEVAEDANGRAEEIKKERVAAWSRAQTARKKLATASYINTDKLTGSHLDTWFNKQAVAQHFEGDPGRSHRVFVLSGERWSPESSASPWAEEPTPTWIWNWIGYWSGRALATRSSSSTVALLRSAR